jgi:hypothetical protein
MDDYPFELKVVPDLVGSVSLDVGFEVGPTRAVLIKDRIMHILESSRSIIWSSRDVGVTDVFPEYDYIGFYHSLFPVMILISNKP